LSLIYWGWEERSLDTGILGLFLSPTPLKRLGLINFFEGSS